MYKDNWTQPWPMGSEIYPEVHENLRAFFSSSSPILLEPLAHGSSDWSLLMEDCIIECRAHREFVSLRKCIFSEQTFCVYRKQVNIKFGFLCGNLVNYKLNIYGLRSKNSQVKSVRLFYWIYLDVVKYFSLFNVILVFLCWEITQTKIPRVNGPNSL